MNTLTPDASEQKPIVPVDTLAKSSGPGVVETRTPEQIEAAQARQARQQAAAEPALAAASQPAQRPVDTMGFGATAPASPPEASKPNPFKIDAENTNQQVETETGMVSVPTSTTTEAVPAVPVADGQPLANESASPVGQTPQAPSPKRSFMDKLLGRNKS